MQIDLNNVLKRAEGFIKEGESDRAIDLLAESCMLFESDIKKTVLVARAELLNEHLNFKRGLVTQDNYRVPIDTTFITYDTTYTTPSDRLKNDSIRLNLATVDSLQLFVDTEGESIVGGKINTYDGHDIQFYSLSDPLPLIPIIIGAMAVKGTYELYQEYKSRRKQAKMAAIVKSKK